MSIDKFDTGAQREAKAGMPRPDLIPPEVLWEWGVLMSNGAAKHGDRNWERGIPMSSFLQSASRHMMKLQAGWTDENHLANLMFNLGGLVTMRARIEAGLLPAELNDLPEHIKHIGTYEKIPRDLLYPIDTEIQK